jgi:peptide/nickel transport system substrate-binding protein
MKMKAATAVLVGLLMTFSLLAACSNSQESLSQTNTQTDNPSTGSGTANPSGTGAAAGDTGQGASTDNAKETPRNETLYINGLQWGAPTNFNLLSGNPAFPINYGNSRELIYETLFMINMIDGKLEPLLGSSYTWTDDKTLKIELNKDAKWSDGQPFTSDDVVYTYKLGQKYET